MKLVSGLVFRVGERVSEDFGLFPAAAGVNGRFKAPRQGRQHCSSAEGTASGMTRRKPDSDDETHSTRCDSQRAQIVTVEVRSFLASIC